jgi:type I restriction enzyme, S subunit
MSDLPKGWVTARLDELLAPEPAAITDGPFGSNLKTEHYQDSGPRVIRLQNIGDGAFRDERAHISVERFQALGKHEARAGDIIVAALGETLPRACLVPPGLGPAIVKADCIRVRLHPEMDARFVSAMLNSPPVRKDATAQISGVGRPRLNLAKIRSIRLPVPPVKEQERIVAAIEVQFSRLDAAEQLLRSALQRRNVLYRSFMRTLEKWPLVPLATLLEKPLANGRSVPTAENGSGFPVLRLTALRDGFVDLSERKLGAWGRREAERYIVQEGDFLIARGNGSLALVGRGGLVTADPDGVAYPDTMIRARVDQKQMSPEFLRWVWSSSTVRRQIESAAKTTAGIYKVNQQDLGGVAVPVPPPEVQGAIVEDLGRQQSVLEALTRSIHQALARSNQLRRSILEHAFAGELVPQDPDDELAPELLERIASDHRTSTTRRRRQRA